MKSLFVGNMSFQTTENDLRPLFEELGRVSKVQIVMDRETGRARGFAFVEMPNDDEAIKAIKTLDGREVAGRVLKINEARPRNSSGLRPFDNRGGDRGSSSRQGRFSTEDYRESTRQPREPRW